MKAIQRFRVWTHRFDPAIAVPLTQRTITATHGRNTITDRIRMLARSSQRRM